MLLGLGRLTAFLAGFMALIVVFLLARIPFLERTVGFDRLTVWHRWAGHSVIYLALTHVVCTVWGYAREDGQNWFQEYWNWLTLPQPQAPGAFGGTTSGSAPKLSIDLGATTTSPYPGIITATIGTFLLVARPRHLARRRAAQALLRVVVRGALHRLRRHRARLVPHDPGRQRADQRPERRRLLARALPLLARARASGTGCSSR